MISLISIFKLGPFNTFLLSTSIASVNWLIFHDILNINLIKIYFKHKNHMLRKLILPVFSILISLIMIFFVLYSESFPFYFSPLSSIIIFLAIFLKNHGKIK
ncbi:MAG: hypothetical protein ACP5JT_03255 [Thermoplasmata archaeon]